MYKIIAEDGQEYGPATAGEMRRWRAENRINAQKLVMHKTAPPCRLATFLAALALLALTGCRRAPSFESFGWQMIEVDRAPEQVAGAVYATHDEMADWKTDKDGKRYDPSFSEHGRSWKAGDHGPGSAIGETTFGSKGGAECVITRITVEGRPLLIYLKSNDDKTAMELHNAFVSNLVKQGVKPRSKWPPTQ
jgi:hypothetical protein